MKYRKRPLVVEAEQFFDNDPQLRLPHGLCACDKVPHGMEFRPHVHTLEGVLLVSKGDWIVRGVKGEFYPVKPEIFAETYEAVAENPNTGHGHVNPRPDGVRARCGGPGLCPKCSSEAKL